MTTTPTLRAAGAMALLLASGAALAGKPAIDGFAVIRPVSGAYVDEFNDGIAPPAGGPVGVFEAGSPLAVYTLNTGASFAAGAENGGMLHFDPATYGPSCTVFGCNRVAQVTLNTNTTPGSTLGLRQAQDFGVYANWSFVAPDGAERYRLRLGDTYKGLASANDVVDIDVRSTANGTQIRLLELDFVAGTANVVNSVTFAREVQATNLVMLFTHEGGSDMVTAQFKLFNGVVPVTSSYVTLGQSRLFDGEDATQAGFGANAPVPEPGTWAMLAAGLGLLGGMARRRARG